MARPKTTQPLPVVTMMPIRDVVWLLAVGAVIGLVTAALYVVFNKFIFEPALCGTSPAAIGSCTDKLTYASGAAMIISGLSAVFALVRMRVFRPLLVVIVVTLALWNTLPQTIDLAWYWVSLVSAVLFALAYTAFAWLVQIRNLYMAFGVSIVLVVVLHLLLGA